MSFRLEQSTAGTATVAFSLCGGGQRQPKFAPVTIAALFSTLVLIFAFQADNITRRFFNVVLIAVPITLQVYFNGGVA